MNKIFSHTVLVVLLVLPNAGLAQPTVSKPTNDFFQTSTPSRSPAYSVKPAVNDAESIASKSHLINFAFSPHSSTALINLLTVVLREEYLLERKLAKQLANLNDHKSLDQENEKNSDQSNNSSRLEKSAWLRAGLAIHIRHLAGLHSRNDDLLRGQLLVHPGTELSGSKLPAVPPSSKASSGLLKTVSPDIPWRIALLDKTTTEWKLLPLEQNPESIALDQFYEQPAKAAQLRYFLERSHLAVNVCPTLSENKFEDLLSMTKGRSSAHEQALICAIRAQPSLLSTGISKRPVTSGLMAFYITLSQSPSPFTDHLGIQAELAGALVEVGNYPEALRILYKLQDDNQELKLIYNIVQRIFAMVQRGDGSVALQNP